MLDFFRTILISFTMFSTVLSLLVISLHPYPNNSTTTTLLFFANSFNNGSKSSVGAAVPRPLIKTIVLSPSPFVETCIFLPFTSTNSPHGTYFFCSYAVIMLLKITQIINTDTMANKISLTTIQILNSFLVFFTISYGLLSFLIPYYLANEFLVMDLGNISS